jgi:hypothetical protein
MYLALSTSVLDIRVQYAVCVLLAIWCAFGAPLTSPTSTAFAAPQVSHHGKPHFI